MQGAGTAAHAQSHVLFTAKFGHSVANFLKSAQSSCPGWAGLPYKATPRRCPPPSNNTKLPPLLLPGLPSRVPLPA